MRGSFRWSGTDKTDLQIEVRVCELNSNRTMQWRWSSGPGCPCSSPGPCQCLREGLWITPLGYKSSVTLKVRSRASDIKPKVHINNSWQTQNLPYPINTHTLTLLSRASLVLDPCPLWVIQQQYSLSNTATASAYCNIKASSEMVCIGIRYYHVERIH